jgi:hypothetical protein
MSDTDQKATGNATEIALKWMFGQPFNNVMLIAIFSGIAWFAHYSVTIAVPSHLKMIQQGYESLDKTHHAERSEMRLMYDKWFDRIAAQDRNAHAATVDPPSTSENN